VALFIIIFLLFLGIAFFQTIQGAYSALIMMVLTFLSAAVAVNFYGPLSKAYLLDLIPEYADTASLMVIFSVTLVVLRTLADSFVRGNIVIWEWPDRIVAGLLSIPTAMVLVGISAIGLQLLPFDTQLMYFNRFNDDNEKWVRSGLLFTDDVAAGMMARFSGGCLEGSQNFALAHPDWPGEISAQRIAVQRESRHAVMPDTVKVSSLSKREAPLLVKEFRLQASTYRGGPQTKTVTVKDKRFAANGYYYLVAKMVLDSKAADPDGKHRFGWGQIRLVGFNGTDRKTPINCYAIGVRDPDLPGEFNYLRVTVEEPPPSNDDEAEPTFRNYGYIARDNSAGSQGIDVVFEVPENFTPWFLEYKRWARTTLPKISNTSPTTDETPKAEGEKRSVGEAGSGMQVEFTIDPARTAFSDELPFTVTSASGAGKIGTSDAEISSAKYVRGQISGKVGTSDPDALDGRTGGRMVVIKSFDVPQNKRLLRMECVYTPMQTQFLQKVFGSVQNVMQKKAISTQGQTYLPVGQYIMVEDGAGKLVELNYDPESEATGRLEPFRDIQLGQVKDKTVRVGFLFLIDPGTEMSRFEVGGAPFQVQTLQLKAPN